MGDLFKEKTIKQAVKNSDLKISKIQKDSANEWIKLLEKGELKAEKSNNLIFMKKILNDLLGYSFEDVNYEKDNVEFSFSKDEKRKVLIETKGTKTDLKKPQFRNKGEHSTPIKQLFDYLNLDATRYGILTNYRKFMLFDYKVGQQDCYEFDFLLIKDNLEKLKEFILIFSKVSLIDEKKVEKIKQESEIQERDLTKRFYALYHETRLMLLNEFKENGFEQKEALHYAQLYLNRLMFVFFAEDIGLVQPRIFESSLINSLKNISENSSHFCDEIVVLFEDLDKGALSKGIQQFNGGLFKEKLSRDAYFKDSRKESFFEKIYTKKKDLDKNLSLSPEEKIIFHKAKINWLSPIIENMLLMVSFDFKSDLKVNILGHIFEQSLSDLEELKEENISKRKKEGIYYTPEYITDYICRNTIIPYLSKSGTNDVDKLIEEHSKDLEVLEEKFRKIKILDPACGSGAFLIKAVDILLEISEKVQKLKQDYGEYEANKWNPKKKAGQLTFKKIDEKIEIKRIIENNIYGVDLNEESIETTKLSLFLRIARKNHKLPDLSNHIKCGNSLIDDKEIAGDKAFNWKEKFKEIFDNGGFDIVVGNPPYLRIQGLKGYHAESARYYEKNYTSATSNYDIYVLFMERVFGLINDFGKVSFILPHKFMVSEFGKGIRKFLVDNKAVQELISFGSKMVFNDASTYTCIINLSKNNKRIKFIEINPLDLNKKINFEDFDYSDFSQDKWDLSNKKSLEVLKKIKEQPLKIKDVFPRIFQGIATGSDKIFLIRGKEKGNSIFGFSEELQEDVEIERNFAKPILKGEDISKYAPLKNSYWVLFPYEIKNGKATPMSEKHIKENFPKGFDYLKKNEKKLRQREKGRFDNSKEWFLLSRKQGLDFVEQKKIITPNFSFGTNISFDKGIIYHNSNCYSFIGNNFSEKDYKFYLSLLNSSIMWFFIKNTSPVLRGDFRQFKTIYLKPFPIPKISPSEQKPFIEKADLMLKLNKEFYEKKNKFLTMLKSDTSLEKFSKKLDNFYLLDWTDFEKELQKQKVILKGNSKDDWFDRFNKYKSEIFKFKEQINQTDKEIDKMVYALYGLNDKEIKVIEDSI